MEQQGYKRRKKVCQMCLGKPVDYKNANIISKYITEKGKIQTRKATGNCAAHQRYIAKQVKRARYMAIIPYSA